MGMIARQIRRVLPPRWQPPARYIYERAMGMLERELPLAVAAVKRGDTVVDVGANVGIYTYVFSRTGARVEAFEPQADCSATLRAFASTRQAVNVHSVALGAASGKAQILTPLDNGKKLSGFGKIVESSGGSPSEDVHIEALDSYELSGVSLIKIDVEGAELDVLEGATDTLSRNRPLLLVEIEERHREGSIDYAFDAVTSLGYDGAFLDEAGKLRSISEFDLDRHQRVPLARGGPGPYVNNFLFTPRNGARRWADIASGV